MLLDSLESCTAVAIVVVVCLSDVEAHVEEVCNRGQGGLDALLGDILGVVIAITHIDLRWFCGRQGTSKGLEPDDRIAVSPHTCQHHWAKLPS